MADLENDAPNLDSMDEKGIGEIKERMSRGEDVSVKAEKPVVEDEAEVPEDDTEAPEPEAKEAKPKSETVSFKQFDKERHRRLDSESRADQMARDNAKLIEQVNQLLARQTPDREEPQPQTAPDPTVAPIEAIQYFAKEFEAFKNETTQERTERVERDNQTRQVNDALAYARQEFGVAAKSDPTIEKAYGSLLESMAREFQAFGTPDQEIEGKLREVEQQHIFYALNNKIPLGDYVKRLASARGWKPEAAAPVVDEQATPAAVNDSIRKSAVSLSNAGGGPARTTLPSPQVLLDMTPQQYAKYRETHTVNEAFSR